MSVSQLIQPSYHYDGPFGKASEEDILDITASRLQQQMFPSEDKNHSTQEDYVEDQILQLQLESRQKRDLMIDNVNPREEVAHNMQDEQLIDLIPNLREVMLDMSVAGDDTTQSHVRLYQDSLQNFQKQQNAFNTPSGVDPYNSEKDLSSGMFQSGKGASSAEVYSFEGNAAGKMMNYLDEDGERLNTVYLNVAF